MNNAPLVSICATFFNSERYIHRFLDCCLNQTYKNIEIVILDDASSDGSEKVIREYAMLDSRVKYFRNSANTRLAESLLKLFKLATGEFSIMVGADDWLAEDFIERGVRNFREHPNIAGVIPRVVSLTENGHNSFRYSSETNFSTKILPAEWFIKRMYRPVVLYISGYALVRSSDLVSGEDYHVEHYYRKPLEPVPEELREFFQRGYGTDSVLFTEILTRYKCFMFDNSMDYIKTTHSSNQYFDSSRSSFHGIFKDAYYFMLIYKFIYKFQWPSFYRGMKIFRAAEALSTVYINFARSGFSPSFLDISKSKELISKFFSDFSSFEIATSIIRSIPMIFGRCAGFVRRKITGDRNNHYDKAHAFTSKRFLDAHGTFLFPQQ